MNIRPAPMLIFTIPSLLYCPAPLPPLLDFFIHWKTFMGAIPTNTRVKDVKFYKAPIRPKIFFWNSRTGEEANWRLSQNLRLKMFKKMTQCIFVVELFDLFWNRRQKRRERGWNLTLSQKLRCRWPVIVSESTTIYTFSTEADQWGPIHHKLGSRNKLRSRLIIKFAGDTQRHSSHSESNMQIQRCQKSLQLSCESIKT